MTKQVKRGVVARFIKKNPLAPASLVVKETGCSLSCVYLTRKRLGLPTRLIDQNDALFDAVNLKSVEPKTKPPVQNHQEKHPMQTHHEEIARLQGRFALAKTAIAGLSAVIVVGAVALVFVFKQ